MYKLALLFFQLLLIPFLVSSQSSKRLYKYEVEKKNYVLDSSIYDCIESEFEVVRMTGSKNEFSDFSFYTNGRDTLYKNVDSFKIVNDQWYIKRKTKWEYFFSKQGFLQGRPTPYFYLLGKEFYLSPYKKGHVTKDGDLVFEFKLKSKTSIDNPIYVFNPEIGFVSMEAGRCRLILIKQKIE